MTLSDIQFIKVDEYKKVDSYIIAKVRYPVWLNYGRTLSDSFPRTLILFPEDPNKEIEISNFMEYEDIPEDHRDDHNAEFGGHRITNLKDWNDTGDAAENCSNYEQFKTSKDIEIYLKKHPCGWW